LNFEKRHTIVVTHLKRWVTTDSQITVIAGVIAA